MDVGSGRTTGSVSLPGIADALVVTSRTIWVATVPDPTGKAVPGYAIARFDPRPLRRTLLVEIT